ncbi:MAG: glycoside hydrolase family 13 protein [Alteromonadaceae bacterium]|nr:glycoside hydrolase family 13 protein [Alteromonadaceae bacterium]
MLKKLSLSVLFALMSSCSIAEDKIQQSSKEFVPLWAKSAIWYQIFPERFRDGDLHNNPTVKDILGADPVEVPKEWQVHPWGSDWYKRQAYELANGEPELWKHLLRRRYGGDLQGIIDKLDYLTDLGINAIYLNPIFDSPSLHKYDGASYHHIDPNFGPDPDGDRIIMATEVPFDPKTWRWTKADELALKLIDECHQRGIRIIFDGVFNHMGINSFAFKDVKKNQQHSPYKDWFTIHSFEDKEKGTTFIYDGWFGVKSLPEWRENEQGIVNGPKEYIFNATKRWMNPKNKGASHGIDGWRLDVAFEVAHPFWKDWRILVKSINPQAYLTAEIVAQPEKVKPYMQGDEFDGEMNYNFAFTAAEFLFNPQGMDISPSQFDRKLKQLRDLYPVGVAYVNQNLFGSHDANRIASHIVNRGIGNFRDWGNYFNLSQAANNPNYKVRKPNQTEIQLQKLFIMLQMTYVGAPMIYYGDEVGMWGGNDPDNRKPMLWPDIDYEDEQYLPDGSKRENKDIDQVFINTELKAYYQKLIHIRQKYPALQVGDFKALIVNDDKNIYGFQRSYSIALNKQVLWVLFNNAATEQKITIKTADVKAFTDLISMKKHNISGDQLIITVPAKSSVLLLKKQ